METKIKKFLFQKYLEWQKGIGQSRTKKEFANYLEVPETSLSGWMNGANDPKGENLGKLASKLGVEIYEILGLPPPDPMQGMSLAHKKLYQLLISLDEDEIEDKLAQIEKVIKKNKPKGV